MKLVANTHLRLADKPNGDTSRGVVRKIALNEEFDVDDKFGKELLERKLASRANSSDAEATRADAQHKDAVTKKVAAGVTKAE